MTLFPGVALVTGAASGMAKSLDIFRPTITPLLYFTRPSMFANSSHVDMKVTSRDWTGHCNLFRTRGMSSNRNM